MRKTKTKPAIRKKRGVCQSPFVGPLVVRPSLATLEFWGFPVRGIGKQGGQQPSAENPPGTVYRVFVHLLSEEEGVSVYATHLPGCASQGDTIEEALANITEALKGVLPSYLEDGAIPWRRELEPPLFSEKKVVVVDLREKPS